MAVRPMKVWNAATSTWDDVAVSQRGDVVNKTDFAAKGDIIAGTGTSAYDNVAAGSNGQMLMADSSATAGLRYVDPPTNRNLLINGAMQVHQRGASRASISASSYNTADRWVADIGGLGTWTNSIENDAPSGTGLTKSFRMLCTTADPSPAASDIGQVQQRLEGQDVQRLAKGSAAAQPLTASFWVKSNVTGTYVLYVYDNDNIRIVSSTYSISSANTWERKTVTFPADTTGAFDNDNAGSLFFSFVLGAGSGATTGALQTTWGSVGTNYATGQVNVAAATNNYWQVTGVQLEVGPVATPFEFEPYEATLRKCQRYYYLAASGSGKIFSNAFYFGASVAYGVVHFPTTMRTGPSVVVATGTNFYEVARASGAGDFINSITLEYSGENASGWYNNTEASGVAGAPAYMGLSSASASIAFSAEL